MQERLRSKDRIIARLEEEKDLLASKCELYHPCSFNDVWWFGQTNVYAPPSTLTFEMVSIFALDSCREQMSTVYYR